MVMDSSSHYDRITDAWKEFMGAHFHFGYFPNENTPLERATEIMIEKMAELGDITPETRVLDVGCGIGAPAFYLHEKYGCSIEGISTSECGIRHANRQAQERGYERVRFKLADGMDNGFPDHSFDLVWIMEAAHPIPDKKRLFAECHRVLRPGGTLLMCDVMQRMLLAPHKGVLFFLSHLRKYYRLMKAWGPAQVPTMGAYADRLVEAGFTPVTIMDITEWTKPTLKRWRENALRFLGENKGELPEREVQDFVAGCEITDSFFRMGLFGYAIIKADKPPS